MKPGDMCRYLMMGEMCMIVREIRHPLLNFMKPYVVVDSKGKEHRVSETFLQPVM